MGALGQHVARRFHQRRRDDVVQPLRVGRRGRLAAPHRGRPCPRRARLPRTDHPSSARRWTYLRVRSSHHPYGLAESSWRIKDGQFHLAVTLPPSTRGEVIWPDMRRRARADRVRQLPMDDALRRGDTRTNCAVAGNVLGRAAGGRTSLRAHV
ncbi:MAG: alpha-L-rhamnosidase C-terminal domain-containing protein [Caldilineaceae bacterium]